jgi:hypothetical protein
MSGPNRPEFLGFVAFGSEAGSWLHLLGGSAVV